MSEYKKPGEDDALRVRRAYLAALRERDALRDERNELLAGQAQNEKAGERPWDVRLRPCARCNGSGTEPEQERYGTGLHHIWEVPLPEDVAAHGQIARQPVQAVQPGRETTLREFLEEAPVQAGCAWDDPLPKVAPEAPPEAEPPTWEEHEKAKAAVSPEPDSVTAGQGAEPPEQTEPVPEAVPDEPSPDEPSPDSPWYENPAVRALREELAQKAELARAGRLAGDFVLISRADLRELLDGWLHLPRDPYDRPLYKRAQELVSGPAHQCPAAGPQGASGAPGDAQGLPETARLPLDTLARSNRALQDTVARLANEKEDLKEAFRQRTVQRDLAEQDARELHERLSAKLEQGQPEPGQPRSQTARDMVAAAQQELEVAIQERDAARAEIRQVLEANRAARESWRRQLRGMEEGCREAQQERDEARWRVAQVMQQLADEDSLRLDREAERDEARRELAAVRRELAVVRKELAAVRDEARDEGLQARRERDG